MWQYFSHWMMKFMGFNLLLYLGYAILNSWNVKKGTWKRNKEISVRISCCFKISLGGLLLPFKSRYDIMTKFDLFNRNDPTFHNYIANLPQKAFLWSRKGEVENWWDNCILPSYFRRLINYSWLISITNNYENYQWVC